MPACPGRRGSTSGSSSSRGIGVSRPNTRAALAVGLNRIGRYFGFQVPKDPERCEMLVDLYKECRTNRGVYCSYYLEVMPVDCPAFNKDAFLRTLRSSNSKSNGKKRDQSQDQSR